MCYKFHTQINFVLVHLYSSTPSFTWFKAFTRAVMLTSLWVKFLLIFKKLASSNYLGCILNVTFSRSPFLTPQYNFLDTLNLYPLHFNSLHRNSGYKLFPVYPSLSVSVFSDFLPHILEFELPLNRDLAHPSSLL